ncbi:hypothetical protein CIT292_06808 [Citrobacter youngae ATCC 29220]|uniref:Uncharacterized protein n=1 Tax=Citrobacter youngae ATCC 29220 TaxID=500640 RepID=D4B8M5_9ENTR|nr:hypothetical protein CIT292_06808 [Citrobacter youngae ATCC 29220]
MQKKIAARGVSIRNIVTLMRSILKRTGAKNSENERLGSIGGKSGYALDFY